MADEEVKEESEKTASVNDEADTSLDSDLEELEEEFNKLEEDIESEMETELSQISERVNKLKHGLSVAQEIEKEMKELESELLDEKEEKEKYVNRLHRLKADFSNYKKRMEREKDKIADRAVKDFVSDLLPVIDNFERAIDSFDQENENDLEGIEKIHKQLSNLLKKKEIEVIDTVGEEFDPNLHEMMLEEESDEYESGVIIEELQKGYIYDGIVIRPAMVKVAK
ncbi:nucleotide exchange factor GrpE [Halanaerobacter jeridensis]|uniref:Protein GrpE n=1 Tax=Halanaerobacter jeridensis TaxID=706427 RepID=A0A938XRC5_9FIRM|nr:nucleotide exchange factor GrpE [Halanaerobacter jeridensis]MBM7556231.1 molecular chaperone GrpE [Halanaerobacter jeridensis]